MQSSSLIFILISAAATQAFSLKGIVNHVFKRAPDSTKCLRANHYEWVSRKDPKVPPCWIENEGKFDCYEYQSGTACPRWEGMFDITKSTQEVDEDDLVSCHRGGMDYVCKLKDGKCPPCWIKSHGRFDCYEYENGKNCPKWPGIFDYTKKLE